MVPLPRAVLSRLGRRFTFSLRSIVSFSVGALIGALIFIGRPAPMLRGMGAGTTTTMQWSSASAETAAVVSRVVNRWAPHTSDLSIVKDVVVAPAPPADEIPQLAIFVRAGTAFLERCVASIDFPVHTLVIIQDSADDERVIPAIDALAAKFAGVGRLIRFITHIINTPHTGCAQAWNTAFRVHPNLRFWLFSANDVQFPPGVLGRFYSNVRRDAAADPDLGMVSASVDFGTDGNHVRGTFGLMTWAVTRQGILRGGLYDENFFPGYYEDDDIVWRFWLAGLKFFAYPDVVILHGGTGVYKTGTMEEDKSGEFSAEVGRSRNKDYYIAKWGPATRSIDYSWLADPANLAAVRASCTSKDAQRFCTPFASGRPVWYWEFEPKYRACVRDGSTDGGDCGRFLPRGVSGDGGRQAVVSSRDILEEEHQLFDASYAQGVVRLKPVMAAALAGPWDPDKGWGTRNQGMLWDLYEPIYNCHNRQRLGRVGDGGKWVCNLDRITGGREDGLPSKCVVYSFGSNGEISFEEDLLAASHGLCDVHIFDPVLESVLANNRYFNGPEATDLQASRNVPHVVWHTEGLGARDGDVESTRYGKMHLQRLSTIMSSLGHTWVDVLKIDVEGYEWDIFLDDILPPLLAKTGGGVTSLPFGQLLIELHSGDTTVARVMEFFERAEASGLRIFNKDPVQYASCSPLCRQIEFSFVNVHARPRIY